MLTEVVVALIGAVAVVIASIISFISGKRQERIERDKIQVEREKIQSENDRFKSDLEEKTKQINYWKTEAEKNLKDRDRLMKLLILIKDDSSKKLSDRMQIQVILTIFDQSSIVSVSNQDPIEVFRSIRKTRILLKEHGFFSFNEKEIDNRLHEIKQLIQEIEVHVRNRCPQLIRLVVDIENQSINVESERLKQLSELFNQMSCSEVIRYIEQKHGEILKQIRIIQKRAHELSDQ